MLRSALGAQLLESLLLLLLSKRKHRTNKNCIQRNFLSYLMISRNNLFRHPQNLPPSFRRRRGHWPECHRLVHCPSLSLSLSPPSLPPSLPLSFLSLFFLSL